MTELINCLPPPFSNLFDHHCWIVLTLLLVDGDYTSQCCRPSQHGRNPASTSQGLGAGHRGEAGRRQVALRKRTPRPVDIGTASSPPRQMQTGRNARRLAAVAVENWNGANADFVPQEISVEVAAEEFGMSPPTPDEFGRRRASRARLAVVLREKGGSVGASRQHRAGPIARD